MSEPINQDPETIVCFWIRPPLTEERWKKFHAAAAAIGAYRGHINPPEFAESRRLAGVVAEECAVRERLADLLDQAARLLHDEPQPPELVSWSFADIPDRIAALLADRGRLAGVVAKWESWAEQQRPSRVQILLNGKEQQLQEALAEVERLAGVVAQLQQEAKAEGAECFDAQVRGEPACGECRSCLTEKLTAAEGALAHLQRDRDDILDQLTALQHGLSGRVYEKRDTLSAEIAREMHGALTHLREQVREAFNAGWSAFLPRQNRIKSYRDSWKERDAAYAAYTAALASPGERRDEKHPRRPPYPNQGASVTPAPFSSRYTCRICGNALRRLFDVPAPLLSNFPQAVDPPTPVRVPLDVMQCLACTHVQLLHTVDPALMYAEYWYESGVNERMRQELATIVKRAQDFVSIDPGDAVLDIGANDGTLLGNYPASVAKVAVEPAQTFQQTLRQIANLTIPGTFPECADKIPVAPYKIITTIAMFYDLEDPVSAAMHLKALLHPYGVWVCQFQDLESQVRLGVWDNFVHEHLSYHTLETFMRVCTLAGLEVVDVESTAINGGSLRVFVRHRSVSPVAPAVKAQWLREQDTLEPLWALRFEQRMYRNISQIRAFIEPMLQAQQPVDLYGASTKGNTLLQALGYRNEIRAAWERNPRKFGRTTVTGVPIIDEELGRKDPPALLLTTIWQFRQQIVERERDTLRQTRLLLPLPDATLVERA